MKKVSLVFIFSMAIAALANAQATRTWVSGVGDDVNPCSRTAPCKTFAGAISKTASPGIINCLDPGGFGAVTITKSITIDCTGTLGSALSSGVQGIVINTALSTDKVVLRGLDINGAGTTLGTNGIAYLQAAAVTVENCNIANYSNDGIKVSATAAGVHKLNVRNCNILNNLRGIEVIPTGSATCDLDVVDSNMENNNSGAGIDVVSGGCSVTVQNSSLTHCGVGVQVQNAGSTGSLNNVMVTHNTTGVFGGGEIRLNNCSITNNGTGVSGTTRGFQTNMIIGNGAGNAPTFSVAGQ
jgi:hypothetical protein